MNSFDWRKEAASLLFKKNIKDPNKIAEILYVFEGFYECIKDKEFDKETIIYSLVLKDYCDSC